MAEDEIGKQAPRRRWFQFGLGTLLLLVAVAAALTLATKKRRERKRLEAQLAASQENVEKPRSLYYAQHPHEMLQRIQKQRTRLDDYLDPPNQGHSVFQNGEAGKWDWLQAQTAQALSYQRCVLVPVPLSRRCAAGKLESVNGPDPPND
ncbi:MAG: hypothetical protein HYX69_11680 [Planctomycetia bacterium]|nr:hypothetical protein [Planctomycetia bacterium]